MTVQTPRGPLSLVSPLVGEHNVMNLLGAIATGLALGLEPSAIAGALGPVSAVPGRFEQVRAGQPFLVVVDYAHTPDALERVLATARKITPGRLGVVFGCGGDRDRTKRPIMGEIAAALGRPRVGHLRQPALRAARGDHRRDPRRACAGSAGAAERTRHPAGPPPGHRSRARLGHGPATRS